MYAYPIDTDNSVLVDRGKWGGGWVEVGRDGENGDICNSVNNKNKETITFSL